MSKEDAYIAIGIAGIVLAAAGLYVSIRASKLGKTVPNYTQVSSGGWQNDEVTEIERDPKTGFIVRETTHRNVEYA